jgi:hypothetical protein
MMLKHIKKTIIFLLVFGLGFMTAYITTNNSFKSISMDNNESIYIISPKSGAEVINPVKVIFGLKGVGVAPAGTKKTNTGHHHLLINLEKLPDLKSPLPSNENLIHFGLGQTETEVRLKKGINTLQLVLGDHMHKPHEPPLISKKIKIIVR